MESAGWTQTKRCFIGLSLAASVAICIQALSSITGSFQPSLWNRQGLSLFSPQVGSSYSISRRVTHPKLKHRLLGITSTDAIEAESSWNKTCFEKIRPSLKDGRIPVVVKGLTEKIVAMNISKDILPGGIYKPTGCQSEYMVAILVPYRDRKRHILPFLYHMHRFLVKQQAYYRIFFLEQVDENRFNRGILFNIGYVESQKLGPFNCLVFSDVDTLPVNQRHQFDCKDSPKHLAAYIDNRHERYKGSTKYYHYATQLYFGGVSAMTPSDLRKVNGFSNLYFGWGSEDDNLFRRMKAKGMQVHRYYNKKYWDGKYYEGKKKVTNPELMTDVGHFHALQHPHNPANANPHRNEMVKKSVETMEKDGLSTLDFKYHILSIEERPFVTWIRVKLKPPPPYRSN